MKANLGAAMVVVAESWCLGFFAKKISVDNGPQLPRDGIDFDDNRKAANHKFGN